MAQDTGANRTSDGGDTKTVVIVETKNGVETDRYTITGRK
jgi:hypothetical protein